MELTSDTEDNSTPLLRWSPRSHDHAMENMTWSMSDLETYKQAQSNGNSIQHSFLNNHHHAKKQQQQRSHQPQRVGEMAGATASAMRGRGQTAGVGCPGRAEEVAGRALTGGGEAVGRRKEDGRSRSGKKTEVRRIMEDTGSGEGRQGR